MIKQESPPKQFRSIKGWVSRILFKGENFTIGLLREGGESIKFVCERGIEEGEEVDAWGALESHARYGQQWRLAFFPAGESPEDARIEEEGNPGSGAPGGAEEGASPPGSGLNPSFSSSILTTGPRLSRDDLAAFLAGSKRAKGIGPGRATILADALGDAAISAYLPFLRDSELLTENCKALCLNALGFLAENSTRALFLAKLMALGLHEMDAERLGDQQRWIAWEQYILNPYLLIGKLPKLSFYYVDTHIAIKRCKIRMDDPRRIRAGIQYAVNKQLYSTGNCYESLEVVIPSISESLKIDKPADYILSHIELAAKQGDITKIIHSFSENTSSKLISTNEIAEAEQQIASALTAARKYPNRWLSADHDFLIDPKLLNISQRAAISKILSSAVSLISGSAGTGKTHLIGIIANVINSLDISAAYLSPTGKAARRLEQFAGSGSTIHRFLQYRGSGFAKKTIEERIVVIDEFSMVDSQLFNAVLSRMDLSRQSLILVGDHQQLPSVAPGSVLRDIIVKNLANYHVLNTVVRQAGILQKNSSAICIKSIAESETTGEDSGAPSWIYEEIPTEGQLVKRFFKRVQELLAAGARPEDIHILAPQKRIRGAVAASGNGWCGVNGLNKMAQYIFQKGGAHAVKLDMMSETPIYRIGDKILLSKNDYTCNIMNGDIMSVVAINDNGEYDGDGNTYDKENFAPSKFPILSLAGEKNTCVATTNCVELGYATTIHKAQGNEWPHVIVVLPDWINEKLCSVNTLYTAVTRARRSVTILSEKFKAKNCLRQFDNKRNTLIGLIDKLVL